MKSPWLRSISLIFVGILLVISVQAMELNESEDSGNITEVNNDLIPILKSELINETLEIKNIGDIDFSDPITVILGGYTLTKKKLLKVGEAIKINLKQEVKPGIYDIKILPTNETFETVLISKSNIDYYLSYWKHFILLLVILFILYKFVKSRPVKRDEYIEIKGDKRKFIIESTTKPKFKFGKKNKEEFFIVGKSDKPKPPEEGGVMGMFD